MDQHRKTLVYLTGFMGSGKSTIGPILANSLGYEFLDLDRAIEKRAGKKVVDIFRENGELSFRSLETEELKAVSAQSYRIIALGGGTIADPSNLETVRSSGVLVYLKAEPGEIVERVKHRKDRPLLHSEEGGSAGGPELTERVRRLMEERTRGYNRADITVRIGDFRLGDIVDEIVKRLTKLKLIE